MTPRDFTYWLNGFIELTNGMERPSDKQWQAIKDHLQLVFEKETPNRFEDGERKLLLETDRITDTTPSSFIKYVKDDVNVDIQC